MRQTNVCLNRFMLILCKICIPRTHANICARKISVCDENRKKDKKMTGTSGKVTKEVRAQ